MKRREVKEGRSGERGRIRGADKGVEPKERATEKKGEKREKNSLKWEAKVKRENKERG